MDIEDKTVRNIKRLSYALYSHSDDIFIKRLACMLDYEPKQLAKDIENLADYARGLEYGNNI